MSHLPNDKTIAKSIQFFKMLSDKTRLSILLLIKETEMNVSEISKTLNMEQSAVSHQLGVLRSERLVKSRREKRSVYYSPDDQHVYDILNQVIDHALEDDCNDTYTLAKK